MGDDLGLECVSLEAFRSLELRALEPYEPYELHARLSRFTCFELVDALSSFRA